jgi:hypothetical protein
MSVRHHAAFEAIRREHDDVVAALKNARRGKKRGAPGNPAYDPQRLEAAIATAGDAYALLLIATAEGFLRQYLQSVGTEIGSEPKLSMLIDKSFKELNGQPTGILLRPEDKREMHDLRVIRNHYAHGRGTGVFPPVPAVQRVVSRFLSPFP